MRPAKDQRDFNGISTRLGLFYAKRLRNLVDYTFIFKFFVLSFLKSFSKQLYYQLFISNANSLYTVVWLTIFVCTQLYDFK